MSLEAAVLDLRYGLRVLARNPGSTLLATFSLALGIGTNTAVYTGYKAMIARPLDARDPDRMINIAVKREAGQPQSSFSYPDYESLGKSMRSLEGLIAYRPAQMTFSEGIRADKQGRRSPSGGTTLGRLALFRNTSAGSAEYASVFVVSPNYFRVLGVGMLQGRDFESVGAAELARTPAVLISENYWQKRFFGDSAMVGRTILLNGVSVVIAGITPHDFCGTSVGAPSFWVPISLEPLFHSDEQWLRDREATRYRLFGRLAPHATAAQVQAELNVALDRLRALHDPRSDAAKPSTSLVWPGTPFPLPIRLYRGLNLAIALVMAGAAMVLLIACANVASLQLARSRLRDDELRIRLSLGANRLRIVRQLVTEAALVGLMAGTFAFFVTWVMLKMAAVALANAIPGEYGALIFDVNPDLAIFAYVSAVSLIAGFLSGLTPALESSKAALKPSSSGATAPARTRRLQDLLIAAQVSLSLVLMVAAAMAMRSSIRAVAIETGYETRQVVALAIQYPDSRSYDAGRRAALVSELRSRIERLPDVASATNAPFPADRGVSTAAAALEDSNPARLDRQAIVQYSFVQPNYFATLSVPFLLGSTFSSQSERTAIVSESAARELWGGENPIGRTVRLGPTDGRVRRLNELAADGLAYEVVGVTRDTRAVDFSASVSKRVYLRLPDDRAALFPILVRTRNRHPVEFIRQLDSLLTSLDPNLMADCSTLEDMLRQTAPFVVAVLAASISSAVGLLGLMLAVMGIYGTVSYIVVVRTREIGIRMAIGARGSNVLRLVLRESTRPVLAGLAGGTLLAAMLAHFARGLLFELAGVDLGLQALVTGAFVAIGLLASFFPARRATRIDPLIALRYQ
jgi:predicted permease